MGYVNIVINEWSYMWDNGKYLGSDKYNPKDDIKWIYIEIMKNAPFTPGMDKIVEAIDRIKEYLRSKGITTISRELSKVSPVHGHPNLYYVDCLFGDEPRNMKEAFDFIEKELDAEPIIDTINDILIELTDENEWDMKGGDISTRYNGWKVNVQAVGPLKHAADKLGILITITKREGFIRKQSEEVSGRIDDNHNI